MTRGILWTVALLTGCQGAPNLDPSSPEVASLQQAASSTPIATVKVINTADDWQAPVPTAQSGSWTVNAAQSGPWSMSLLPGASVSIENTPTVALQQGATVNVASLPAVSVANFPATQAVSGSVEVVNLPETQAVSGTVAVSNLPATQAVTGAVAVTNLPATQTVSGTVSISNLPATQPVSGTVSAKSADLTEEVYAARVPDKKLTPDIDVSAYKTVRIMAQVICPTAAVGSLIIQSKSAGATTNWDLARIQPTDQLINFMEVFDVPGTTIQATAGCINPFQSMVVDPDRFTVTVFGRR